MIDSETYLLRCHRYIEFNPVRAGMVTAPDAYLWSSHRYYAKGVPSRVITEHPVYRGLGATPEACRHRYLSLCAEPMDALELSKLRTAVNKGRALGSEAFLARLEESLGRRVRPARTGRPPKVPADSVQEGGRQAEMLL